MRATFLGTSLLLSALGCSPSPEQPASQPPPSAVTGPPVSGPAAGAPDVSPALAQAVARVRALIASPDDDVAIQGAFTPEFLVAVPPDKVKSVFFSARSHLGACTRESVLSVKDDTHALFLIQCEHGAETARIAVQPSPPYLMNGMLIHPAGP